MRRTNRTGLVLLSAMGVLQAGPVLAQLPAMPPGSTTGITVTGSGEVQVRPDEAIVRLGVLAQEPTARAAQQKVNQVAREMVAAIQGAGARPEQIQTSQLQLEPVYEQRPPTPDTAPREPRIVAYRASNVVSVRLDALDRVGPVIDAGLAKGANQLEGLQFRLRDDLRARTEALREAAAQARQKAEVLATSLGVRLENVLEISEGGGAVVLPMAESRALEARPGGAPTPVSPGLITVSGEVRVRYRISPRPTPAPGLGGTGEQAPGEGG